MSKLLIIDGHAIMHRAFHAMPPLSTPKGEPINAVHGFVSMLLKIVQDVSPTHIVVAFDEQAPTFRNKALPSYQAQRPPMAGELSSQFAKVKEFLNAANIPYLSKPGYEADDVIGTIADRAVKGKRQEVNEVVIVTGDRDQLQLVNDKLKIRLYMPIAGLINAKLYTEKDATERMGVTPTQVADLKALIGDPSDNYKGVAGIGPKTAEVLLTEYKHLNNIYKHIDDIKPTIRQKLIDNKANAELSYKLATIVCDVPIKFDFPQMEKWDLGSSRVIKLFEEEFGFKTLTARIKKIGEELEEKKQGSLF
jgi:DNA polymerase-1